MKISGFILFTVIAFSSCCTSNKAGFGSKSNPADSGKYYQWAELKGLPVEANDTFINNSRTATLLADAVNAEMKAKGYQLKSGNAAMQLNYYILSEEKLTVLPVIVESGYNQTLNTPVSSAKEKEKKRLYLLKTATLVLELKNRNSQTLLWRGFTTIVTADDDAVMKEGEILNAVERIFKKYPNQSVF